MTRTILTLAVVILFLGSCGGDQGVNPDNGQDRAHKTVSNPFELGFGETVTVVKEGVSVTFAEVIEDSRCPIDAQCIWEGRAVLGLQVIDFPSDTFFVQVALRPGSLGPIPPPLDTLGFRFALIEVRPYPVSFQPIPDSEYVAKLAVFRLDQIDSVDGEVMIRTTPPPVADPFELDTVSIEDDILRLTVWHSGGCGDHDYELYFSPPGFAESFPVQATLKFRHVDHDDPCDAYLKHELAFDLRPIAQFYEMSYGQRDCMILHVSDELSGRPAVLAKTIWYYPTGVSPSPPCSHFTE